MLLKTLPSLKCIFAILLVTGAASCKKNTLENNIENTSDLENSSKLLISKTRSCLFIDYIPQYAEVNKIAGYNLNITDQKTALNNNFASFVAGKGIGLFTTYVRSVDQLWGVRFDPTLNKTVLTKLSLTTKVTTDASIFPTDKLVRKIIGVDDVNKIIYYLQGVENAVNYNKLISCKWDGTSSKELYTDPSNILDGAIDIPGKKCYFVNKMPNALSCIDLNTKKIIYQIGNFNVVGREQKLSLQKVKLVPFTVDVINGKAFWLKENLLNKATYGLNSHRPDVVAADLNGNNLNNLGVYFYKNSIADDKTIIGPVGFTLLYNKGAINIDPVNKKLYILSEYKLTNQSDDPQSFLPEYTPTTILEINYTDLKNATRKNLTPEKDGLQAFGNYWEIFSDVLKGFVFVKTDPTN